MGSPFSTPQVEEQRGRWVPLAIAAAVILGVLIALFIVSRNTPKETGPAPEDPYRTNIQFSNLKLSQAQNFVGASVTYLEGDIANTGVKSVTGMQVECIFRNTMGQVVDRQTQPLMVIQQRPGYADAVPLAAQPLTPNMQTPFRLTFEHISADWNQGLPELRLIKINTK